MKGYTVAMRWGAVLGLVVVWLGWGGSPAEAARNISPKRECSICHVMWLNDFKQERAETLIPYEPKPVVETGRQDVVSTERMCFSCHDGYVRDSRFAWAKREHFHPVGIEPPENIQIPKKDGKEIFPLNDDGKIYCGTCHSAHGVDWSEEYSPLFLRVKNRDSSLCLACHLDRSTGPKEGNHPVYKAPKTIPDRLLEEGAKFGGDGDVICQSCHRIHGAGDDKLLMVENDRSQLCGSCHADRYTEDLRHAAKAGTHPVNVPTRSVTVPEDLLEEGARLSQDGEIICESCHRPHHAEPGASILVDANKGSGLCLRCHSDKRTVMESKHDVAEGETGQAGVCRGCHRPHNGQGPKMWARKPGPGNDAAASTCRSCHRKDGMAEDRQVGVHSHPVGKSLSRVENDLGLPGYDRSGLRRGHGGAVSCPTCHDPHQWDPEDPGHRGGDEPTGSGQNRFLRVRHDSEERLCRGCHADKAGFDGTAHDARAMVAQEPARKDLIGKGPSRCNGCHRVHNGQGPRMWAMEPAAGEDPVSSLCKSCHGPEGAAAGRTVGVHSHPVAVALDRLGLEVEGGAWRATVPDPFAPEPLQPLPLFTAEGGRAQGMGQVTCATCHDPHVHATSEDPEEAAFLRIPNDEEASLCRNCHVDKGQVAQSKHNLRITAPAERNIQGTEARESHPCAACHLPHNGDGPKMWAGFTRPEHDPVAALCLGCHQEGGVAEPKQVGRHSHPLRVDVKSVGLDTSLPLFRTDASRDAADGRVSCATCHDPHQWDPEKPASTEGATPEAEGDGRTSFLRIPAAGESRLCVDCHEDKRWVRETDHDLGVTHGGAENAQGQSVEASGVCSQCHTPHNAEASLKLWAREPGPGQDAMENLCRSCHADGAVAEHKQPRRATHPAHVKAVSVQGWPRPGEVRSYFPVYDQNGEAVNNGVISCPTCHNPHKWRPEVKAEGKGENLEGDVRSSFLRNKSDFSLCTNCHGMDALFRYKYFHGESSRKPHRLFR